MDDFIRHEDGAITKAVTKDGKTVTVFAEEVEESVWILSVLGKNNQASTWHEFFPSQEAAINEGVRAIENEGIDEFYSSEFFVYMEDL